MVLFFGDSNKTQIYKTPNRDNQQHEIEILTSFFYLNLFISDGHKKIITLEKQTMKISYSKSKIKNVFMWEKT